jgi:hypothetical protein
MLVYCDTQHYLGAILVDNELIQVLSQRLGCDVSASHAGCASQRATCGLIGLIEAGKALAAEVGAAVCRLNRTSGVECTAADGA